MDQPSILANPPIHLKPAYLAVLQQTDAEFAPHTWTQLRDVCARKDTASLRRTPTDAWNYLRWIRHTQTEWPSVTAYLLEVRLGWGVDEVAAAPPAPPAVAAPPATSAAAAATAAGAGVRSRGLFAHPAGYLILRNDWPYGCVKGVEHLVVWSKVPIRLDDEEGDPIPEDNARIDGFVRRVFGEAVAAATGLQCEQVMGENVMWFRNRRGFQSVRALEHIHVLLRNVDEALIEGWTGQRADEIMALEWRKKT